MARFCRKEKNGKKQNQKNKIKKMGKKK